MGLMGGVDTPEYAAPLWYLIPEDSGIRHYYKWTWRDPVRQAEVMKDIKERLLIEYAFPYVQDEQKMRSLVSEFQAQQQQPK